MSNSIVISGVNVDFPFKPYGPQIAMMSKIISALKKKENALIESPTGTGKTLALLCASIAWQRAEYENVRLTVEAEFLKQCSETRVQNVPCVDMEVDLTQACLDEDFREPTPKKFLGDVIENSSNHIVDLTDPVMYQQKLREGLKNVPKIYFASRTHKQLIQVIRELNKTDYKSVRMTILASREQSCVNKTVKKSDDLGESCKALLRNENGNSCSFYQKLKKYDNEPRKLRQLVSQAHKKFVANPADVMQDLAFDIEDIVRIGEDQKFCPHFALSSVLQQDAEVIFCPYNYLIDPLVREKVKINTQGQVILFDEAHNIEDTCRDAASFCITADALVNERDSFEAASKLETDDVEYPHAAYSTFASLCSNFVIFMRRVAADDTEMKSQSHGTYLKIWSGADIFVQLKLLGICSERYEEYVKYLQDIYESMEKNRSPESSRNNRRKSVQDVNVKLSTIAVEQILTFCGFLFRENCKYMEDFRMGLEKQNPEVLTDSTSKNKRKSFNFNFAKSSSEPLVSLKIWCMNPAVAFSDIGSRAWSIVLASGTLSPMDTFETELGLPFRANYRLQASHVLPPERMFVRSIGVGPRGMKLRATYDTMYGDEFLDELGFVLLKVCATVPRGVLCFVPSYRYLDVIKRRWFQETGLWATLEGLKVIVTEPKDGGELRESMETFYKAVDNPSLYGVNCSGALFFAVYRGKISEGLDFADDYARVVVSVGIPFPNFKQIEVVMKREYNDKFSGSKNLLRGQQWYEIQAYRALNQALGRCLRHKNDWGSLLLVDERFCSATSQSKLSKWIQRNINHCNNFAGFIEDLKLFTDKFVCEGSESNAQDENASIVSQNTSAVSENTSIVSEIVCCVSKPTVEHIQCEQNVNIV